MSASGPAVGGSLPAGHGIELSLDAVQLFRKGLVVTGWAFSRDPASPVVEVAARVDGRFVGYAFYGHDRPDVASAYAEVAIDSAVGFELSAALPRPPQGHAEVRLSVTTRDGGARELLREVELTALACNVDTLALRGGVLAVAGWAVAEAGVGEVDVLLDGRLVGVAELGHVNPGVHARYPWLVGSRDAGFELQIDVASAVDETGRTAKVEVLAITADGGHHVLERRDLAMPMAGQQRASAESTVPRSVEASPPALATPDAILIVDSRVPEHDKDSGSQRMYSMVKILAREHPVVFFANAAVEDPRYVADLAALGVEVLAAPAELDSYLQQAGSQFHAAILSRPEIAFECLPLVRYHAPRCRVVFDTVDLHWLRMERAYVVTGDQRFLAEAAKHRAMELCVSASVDVVLAVTDDDRRHLLKELPRLRVDLVPNIHDVESRAVRLESRRELMFLGGFEHSPNQDAATYLARELMPRIGERLGPVRLYIVGSKPTEAIGALAGGQITVTGYVEDLGLYFDRTRVFVAPLRYGAGMKGKIGHAMGYGVPVVTSTVGAEGMQLVDGESALIADEPEAFADAVGRLYTDDGLWQRISRQASGLITRTCGSEVVGRRLLGIIDSLRPSGADAAVDADSESHAG